MEQHMQRLFYCAAVLGLIVAIPAAAQERDTGTPGAIPQYVTPAISQKPSTPPLKLSQAQREKIARAVRSQDTEVSFALKPAKAAQNFEPSVGAKVPGGLKLHPLPRPLMNETQPLRRYGYIKFKNQVLIVNPMTRTIVDMFPET
jgi:hypothetical protein